MDESGRRGSVTPFVEVPEEAIQNAGRVPPGTPRPPGSKERVTLRRPPELPGVEHWRAESSTRLWTVYHETYTFCVAERSPGPQSWLYRRQQYGMREGISTMLIEPGEVHVTTKVPVADFQVLLLDPKLVARELGRENLHFTAGQNDDPRVATAFLRACRAIENGDAEVLERQELLRRFLFLAFERAGEQPPIIEPAKCEKAVLRAREVLRHGYAGPVTLDELAKEAGVSKYYLERSFTARFGVPMHRYLKLVRLYEARLRLQKGLRGVDVAHETGFTDAAHMGRVFRAELGFTPGMYARAR